MPVTPEYNHSTSAAMKNTLDYFLEEYYFKPSAIDSIRFNNNMKFNIFGKKKFSNTCEKN
jgi:NADPH-dependent FMN reductase